MLVTVRTTSIREIEVDSYEDLVDFYPRFKGIRFNHVLSTKSSESNSNALTSSLDRFALKAIRSQSDLIITTGKTARDESLRASNLAEMLIITNDETLDIPATREKASKRVLVTVDHLPTGSVAETIGSPGEDLVSWFRSKFGSTYESIVLESGTETARVYAEASLIGEVCLTVTGTSVETVALEVASDYIQELGLRPNLIQTANSESTWLFRFKVNEESR